MQPKILLSQLRRFDAYPKTLEDFRIKTFSGAAVTVISGALMFVLFISELLLYMQDETRSELFVDASKRQKLNINIDITFPRMACSVLTVDAMDVSGEQHIDIDDHVYKRRLTLDGEPISEAQPTKEDLAAKNEGETAESTTVSTTLDPNRCESCYGAESSPKQCCNTCDDVREAYRKKGWAFDSPEGITQCVRDGYTEKMAIQDKEGCQIYGYIQVSKVAGNFHIAPGQSYQQHHVHVHDVQGLSTAKINMSHVITKLSFGDEYPGMNNPLDKHSVIDEKGQRMYQYYVQIVPTTYVDLDGTVLFTNQYSVTKHEKSVGNFLMSDQTLPGVFLMYELSPMMVKYTEKHKSFMHFITSLCAIIGGIFTVAGLVDAFIYRGSKVLRQKMEIGKAT